MAVIGFLAYTDLGMLRNMISVRFGGTAHHTSTDSSMAANPVKGADHIIIAPSIQVGKNVKQTYGVDRSVESVSAKSHRDSARYAAYIGIL